MASLNTATNRVATTGFALQVALTVAGLALSSMATDWMRENVVDLEMAGADALYGFAGALIIAFASTLGFPWKFAGPMATGVAVGGAYSEAQEMGVL